MVTLLLASNEDIASMNIYSEVMQLNGWGETQEYSHGKVTRNSISDVELLLIDQLHIWADGIDMKHQEITSSDVDEVLVLSRHVSSSETPAITLHAIGVPGGKPRGSKAESGGINGKVPPPSTRFAELFRTMKTVASARKLDEKYDLTLETTHHGPLLESPTLYLEIGSTEEQWSDKEAARVWAETISLCLGIEGRDCRWEGYGDVMIGFGGGHYAPRHKAVISESDVWLGHILASYSLIFEKPIEGDYPSGVWQHSVKSAVESTRIAFPGGNVFAHLDRKSFKSWQRNAISKLLSELGVPILRGKQITDP
ncbi:MAG: hypothetical protein CMA12_07460 [Euryarchaeota archaeon]|nr:hypothetical protein [Euryarchaeota archaeon]